METLMWLWNIAKVALGLGFVIFIHELGHFLLAKWNGVKVEKFSIGFGRTIFGFKRGETEYVLAAIPLGGFVKMLGEGGEAGEAPPDPETADDPRAFNNKSVEARMAIISAGVIMNILLAVVCFAYVFGGPREELAATVGTVLPGSPAFQAGLRPGDEIVAIDGRENVSYIDLVKAVSLSKQGQIIQFRVKRGGNGPFDLPIEPRREVKGDKPTIGVLPGASLAIGDYQPPAGTVEPAKLPWAADATAQETLTIVAAGPAGETPSPISSNEAFARLSARHRDKPMELVLQRRTLDDKPIKGAEGELKVTLPPNHLVDLGLRFGFEPIRSIRKGSPAEAAGFKVGDRIIKVDGKDDANPLRLPQACFDKAGSHMTFEIQRAGEGGTPEILTLTATPEDTPPGDSFLRLTRAEDLQIPGLGIAFPVKPTVAAVTPGSPADKAGLKSGDVVDAVTIPATKGHPRHGDGTSKDSWLVPREQTVRLDDGSAAWPFVYGTVQSLPNQPIGLVLRGRNEPLSLKPEVLADAYSSDRGLEFLPSFRTMPPLGFADAVKAGFNETVENISLVFATIRSLSTGRVSFNQIAGPVGMFDMASRAARSSFGDLLRFLGVISINLAVLNFLPIPPLDGGQMLFLIAEKVRGRPLPDSTQFVGIVVGAVLVICLMVFATYQDVVRLLKAYFL